MNDEQRPPKKEEIRKEIDGSLEEFLALIDELSDEQMLTSTDAAGWTVRDHLTHIFAWADGIGALLERKDRWSAMGLSYTPSKDEPLDIDGINNEIRLRYSHVTSADARDRIVEAHAYVVEGMNSLLDADLLLPYERFVEPFTGDWGDPIYYYILADTVDHYNEHSPWIKAIVNNAVDSS